MLRPGFQIEVGGQYLQYLDVTAVLGDKDALPDVHHRNQALCPGRKAAFGYGGFPGRSQKQGFQIEPFMSFFLAFIFLLSYIHCDPL